MRNNSKAEFFLVAALISITVLAALATDLVVPILPIVQSELNTQPAQAQMLISVFLAGYALGQIPCGITADRIGRLPVLYCALGVFFLGSALCIGADNVSQLLVGRFVQGLGSAGTAVMSRTLARDLRSGHELTKLLALYVAVLASLPILGPLIGGWLGTSIGWQSVFMLITTFGLLSILLSVLYLREPKSKARQRHSFAQTFQAFVESRQSVWASLLLGFGFFGFMSILSGFGNAIVDVYQRPATQVGPILSAAMLFFVGSSIFSRKSVSTLGEFSLLKYAAVLFLIAAAINVGIYLMSAVPLLCFVLGIVAYATGLGMLFPNTVALALAPLPHIAGLASSLLGTVQISFAFAGSAITAYLYDGTLSHIAMPLAISGVAVFSLYRLRSRLGVNPDEQTS